MTPQEWERLRELWGKTKKGPSPPPTDRRKWRQAPRSGDDARITPGQATMLSVWYALEAPHES